MVILIESFTKLISEAEAIQKTMIHLSSDHRDLVIVRLKLLNERLKDKGISAETLEAITQQSEIAEDKSKIQKDIEKKEESVNKLKQEIALRKKSMMGKKIHTQEKIQTERDDRYYEETKDDF